MGVSPVGEIKTNVRDWKGESFNSGLNRLGFTHGLQADSRCEEFVDTRFTAMVAAHAASTKWLASVFEGGNTSAP